MLAAVRAVWITPVVPVFSRSSHASWLVTRELSHLAGCGASIFAVNSAPKSPKSFLSFLAFQVFQHFVKLADPFSWRPLRTWSGTPPPGLQKIMLINIFQENAHEVVHGAGILDL